MQQVRGPFLEPQTMFSEGLRLLGASLRRRAFGLARRPGNAQEICEQIVRDCFDRDRRYFRTSTTSYAEFWARDFGRCVPPLLALGFEREVGDTFRYALACYERAGHFSLVLTPSGRPFDFPAYAPDGFALFLYGLEKLDDPGLVRRHRSLLEREVTRFWRLVIDPGTGQVIRGRFFSEAQDYAVRDSSCYSNAVCHLLARQLDSLGLPNPLGGYDYPRLILDRFWWEDHFLDDQSGSLHPSGDAQVMPFWCGVLGNDPTARVRLDRVMAWMDSTGLNLPLPARYGIGAAPGRRMHHLHRLNPWQRDTVWTCLGLQLLEVLADFGHPRLWPELAGYRSLVEELGCFPEILDARTCAPYRGKVVVSEDSMLWAVSLWGLLRGVGEAAPPARNKHGGPSQGRPEEEPCTLT